MARPTEGEFDPVMDQPLAVGAGSDADLIEQRHRALFEQAGADAAEHVVGRLAFQDDVVDSVAVQQLSQQQARWPGADDCYFCPQYLLPRLL